MTKFLVSDKDMTLLTIIRLELSALLLHTIRKYHVVATSLQGSSMWKTQACLALQSKEKGYVPRVTKLTRGHCD